MKLEDLKKESTVTIRACKGLDFIEFTSKVVDTAENKISIEPIMNQGKAVSFDSKSIIYIVTIIDEQKAYVYHGTTITYERTDNGYVHVITSDEDVKPINRRHFYRVFIGLDGTMKSGRNDTTYEVLVKDISANGIGIICDKSLDFPTGCKVRVIFRDGETATNFKLKCIVVRRCDIENGMVLLGCQLPEVSDSIEKYVAQKQRRIQLST